MAEKKKQQEEEEEEEEEEEDDETRKSRRTGHSLLAHSLTHSLTTQGHLLVWLLWQWLRDQISLAPDQSAGGGVQDHPDYPVLEWHSCLMFHASRYGNFPLDQIGLSL